MSKELKKFQAEYDKIMKPLAGWSLQKAESLKKVINAASSNASTGMDVLRDVIVAAREEGYSGTNLDTYLKHPEVASTVKGIKKHQTELLNAVNELSAFDDEGKKASQQLKNLRETIDEDLSTREDKSKSKTDIEKLGAQIDDDLEGLKSTAKMVKNLSKGHFDPGTVFTNAVAAIMRTLPSDLKDESEKDNLPQKFNKRILKSELAGMSGSMGEIKKQLQEVEKQIKLGSKPAALKALKAAANLTREIKETSLEYDKLLDRYKGDLAGTKDEKFIFDAVAKMKSNRMVTQKACIVRNKLIEKMKDQETEEEEVQSSE